MASPRSLGGPATRRERETPAPVPREQSSLPTMCAVASSYFELVGFGELLAHEHVDGQLGAEAALTCHLNHTLTYRGELNTHSDIVAVPGDLFVAHSSRERAETQFR